MQTQMRELYRVRGLSAGLDWILMCPDPGARQALLELVAEEITASVDGVVYALQASTGVLVGQGDEVAGAA